MPDPRQGVFETLLVLAGRPVELDAHLARLRASLTALFPHHPLPSIDVPGVEVAYGPLTPGTSEGGSAEALRIRVAPGDGAALAVEVERREAKPAGRVALASQIVPGGLGEHKWADRSLLDGAQAGLSGDTLPLLVDSDGSALEASRANLFAVRGGALFTPPLDGRPLPGITRGRVLGLAAARAIEAREEALARDDLLAADEVFLTGSVRGIEPAASLDGAPLAGAGPIADRLAAELWRAWTGAEAAAAFG